jgi:transcriptional regulator with XRE-family HTH domain
MLTYVIELTRIMNVMYSKSVIAANIKSARMLRNYSQEYLGLRLKISQNAYSKIEIGKSNISLQRIFEIAEVFEVDVCELIDTQKPFALKLVNG